MSRPGDNLPGYRATQLTFAAHIRHPGVNPAPAGIESRRMQIYVDLFYNNVESFLAGAFPVARKILFEHGGWHPLVRQFLHRHGCRTPYFLEISQEFLSFLATGDCGDLPPFLLELCHYEWVELALSVAEDDLDALAADRDGDLAAGVPLVSPLVWKLGYRYPVHRIGVANQPAQPPDQPTQLIVYRCRDDRVRFMEVSGLTLPLLDALDGERTGDQALRGVIAAHPGLQPESAYEMGLATLERLRKADIVLGTRHPDTLTNQGDRS
jgi:hypothetical protein